MEIVNNFSRFVDFRRKFPRFTYESFHYSMNEKGISVQFKYSIGTDIHFTPVSQIDFQDLEWDHSLPNDELDTIVFHIGLIELISYWKATCSPVVEIRPFALDVDQQKWWNKLWFNGLGEFFYTNSIQTNENDFLTIECATASTRSFQWAAGVKNSTIVPVGGGKDSPVTIELVKSGGNEVIPFVINPRGATLQTIDAAAIRREKSVFIQRSIDPALIELNNAGYLNGHTPFSAMLAFYSLLVSRALGVSDIALSNESSANESTVPGTEINHQYSKSFEFEKDFRQYYSKYISPGFNYFSFLRPLSELQIAQLFSTMPAYHPVFRSCNAGSKENSWCGQCPKCLFAFVILSPFLSPDKLTEIFGKNMLDDRSLVPVFEELTGLAPSKPFECVGTVSEVNEAIRLSIQRFYPDDNSRPWLLSQYAKNNQAVTYNSLLEWNTQHFLLPEYEKTLRDGSGIK